MRIQGLPQFLVRQSSDFCLLVNKVLRPLVAHWMKFKCSNTQEEIERWRIGWSRGETKVLI